MRGFRLNGWQRIGIVLSVVWLIVGSYWSQHLLFNPIYSAHTNCLNHPAIKDAAVCYQMFEEQLANAVEQRLAMVALVGLAPIPIAWLLVWGLVALVRWIRRGFKPST